MKSCACQVEGCVLCESEIYSGLSEAMLCHIRDQLIRQKYKAHDVLFREGDSASLLFAVRTGQIKLTTSLPDGRQQIIRLVVAGQLLGLKMSQGQRYPYTAEALTEVNVCRINLNDLNKVLQAHPNVAMRIIQSLSDELDQAEAHIRDLGLKTAQEKVATFILSLIPTLSQHLHRELPLVLSRREIAEILGLTEETVSRVMAEFTRKKIIDAGRGYVRILDDPSLQSLAGAESRNQAPRNRASSIFS